MAGFHTVLGAPSLGAVSEIEQPRMEVWTLAAPAQVAELPPGVVVRKCATRDWGKRSRSGAGDCAWGWVREDQAGDASYAWDLKGAIDIEAHTWRGPFEASHAAYMAFAGCTGATSHGYVLKQHRPGMGVLGAAGCVGYPQIYAPRPEWRNRTPEDFAHRCIDSWVSAGFEHITGIVSALSETDYHLRVARALVEDGHGVAVWCWGKNVSRRTRAFVNAIHRLVYPV